MANKKLTIFQRLNNIFGPDGVNIPKKSTNRYSIGKDALLKTQDKSEYDAAKLQAQQNKYLGGTWRKVDNELFQKAVHYETTRIGSYSDFESMEFYPEISAALDIFMEESTTANEKGRVLNIYSDSKRVKTVLEDLFFNRLDIHTSLPMWTRNVCKYGDNFVFLNIDDKAGIIGCRQMPNFEIERKEGDLYSRLSNGGENYDGEDPKVKFVWRGRDMEFNSWQIAHFRLLGDDRRLPYGTSVLEKARRIWKQLILSEDAMLIYRVTRAPERRVYKIFVGNIDDEDVPAYVDEIANRFKRTPIIDPQTGQVDLQYNQLGNDQDFFIPVRSEDAPNPIDTLAGACIALDTRIPLLDGRTLELNEIINEWDNGNRDLWVYSCDPQTGKLAPGMITWAGETRNNAEVIKITLDNGEEIITTPDHKWVHRTNGFVEAKDLNIGDSLMPFYKDTKKIKSNTNNYERVWDSSKQQWGFTHRMVTNYLNNTNIIEEYVYDKKYTNKNKLVRHHKDYNRFNNNPSNLVWMNVLDHIKLHQDVILETIWANPKEKQSIKAKELWESEEYKNKVFNKKQKLTFTNTLYNMFFEMFKQYGKVDLTLIELNKSEEFMYEFFSTNKSIRSSLTNLNEFTRNHLNKMLKERGFKNYREWCKITAEELGYKNVRAWRYFINKEKKILYNHKIINIEYLENKMNTGTITVDGDEKYHNYHTFAIESGVFIKNSNLDAIADIEYLQRKLFTALRVPKAFLGFEDAQGDGKNLALQDVRFARTINRIQQALIMELNKIAILHLFLLGLEDELDNFTLTLNNPSTQAEMLKLEHLQSKVNLYKDSVSDAGNGFGVMSMTKAKREILGWSDDEIKQDLLEQRLEKAASAEMENTSEVIKHTGTFDEVDRVYGDINIAKNMGGEGAEGGGEGGGGGGGGFGGGGDMGGLDFGDEGGDDLGGDDLGGDDLGGDDLGGDEGGDDLGGDDLGGGDEPTEESIKKDENLLLERINNNKKLRKKESDFDKLLESMKPKDNKFERVKITDKNIKINKHINDMINDIDKIID